ncbi:MAG: hypothetical protein HEP71_24880 [Roseivirga sp.]|nr:hypothetical protein [Roseivirga sp.]
MKNYIAIPVMVLLGLLLISSLGKAQSGNTEMSHFDILADYLSSGTGKWTGENPNYDPNNPRSAKAFGLWFERPLKGLLTLKIVAYQKDTIIISSQGTFSWHPKKKQYVHTMTDRGNGFAEGVTEFPDDKTFISTMINYRPNGQSFDHKDENFVVDENVHRNVSYSKDTQGNWVEAGRWVWKRNPKQ